MTRILTTVCLVGPAIIGNMLDEAHAEDIAFNYNKITFYYVWSTVSDNGIAFGVDSTFPALPAEFFGPGSEPFSGNIPLKGSKNVVMERMEGAVFGMPPMPQDIPIEINALDLASVQPMVVTYSGGAMEQWDVQVNLNPRETSGGVLRVTHNASGELDGGAILAVDSFFDIFADVTFSHTPPSGTTRHRLFSIIDRTQLSSSGTPQWAHQHWNIAGGADREFVPGSVLASPSRLQVLAFKGGGLDLLLRVTDVVPEPSSMMLVTLASLAVIAVGFRRRS